jgi:hypothetical protein
MEMTAIFETVKNAGYLGVISVLLWIIRDERRSNDSLRQSIKELAQAVGTLVEAQRNTSTRLDRTSYDSDCILKVVTDVKQIVSTILDRIQRN